MKQCRKCLKIREESCFYRKNNICTDCIVEKVRKWRRDNPKKFLETANTRRVKNREKIREYSNNWRDAKKQSGHYGKCIDCGDNLGRNDGFKGKNRNGYCVKCNKGVRHQNFKGGSVNRDGYRVIGGRNGGLEHRLIAEKVLGRKLNSFEHVHHIDGNKLNNNPSNLSVMEIKEHQRFHMMECKYNPSPINHLCGANIAQ